MSLLRLQRAAVDVFSRPALWWALAGIFGLWRLYWVVANPQRLDAEGMWDGAHAYLTDPSHMYDAAADYLSRLHVIAPPGRLDAFVSPPTVAVMAAPFALLTKSTAVQVWAAFDAAMLLFGVLILLRAARPSHPLAHAVCWTIAGFFTPVFADVSAGQRGGVLLALAVGSVWLERSRPALAGVVGGMAAAIKYYPAAMIVGPRPEHRVRYGAALFAALVVVTVLSFVPLGFNGTVFYYQHVLLPSLGSHNPDCAYDSVRTLFTRTIGGEEFAVPSANGYVLVSSPLHFFSLAVALSYLSALLFGAGTVWAAWRSGWNPIYGMSLGFGLGAVIPNEVWPYQWLPLLPIVLLLAVRALERRRVVTLTLLGVFLICFLRQPCALPFPNLWTLAGIGVFVLGVWENQLFRTSELKGDV